MKSQGPGQLRPSSVAKRAAVLRAAEGAFLSARYDDVTMDDIADASHVSKQTVYAHFGTKERLLVELVTAMTREAGDTVSADAVLPESPGDVAQMLTAVLSHQLAVVLSPRLLRLRRLVISEVPRFPALARAVYEQGPLRAGETLAGLLREMDVRGWVRVPDPVVAAEQLNWLVMGAPTNAAMYLGDDVAPAPQDQQAHVRAAVRTFLAAYARPPDTGVAARSTPGC